MSTEKRQILFGLLDNESGTPLYFAEAYLSPVEVRKIINMLSHQLNYRGAEIKDMFECKPVNTRLHWPYEVLSEDTVEVKLE